MAEAIKLIIVEPFLIFERLRDPPLLIKLLGHLAERSLSVVELRGRVCHELLIAIDRGLILLSKQRFHTVGRDQTSSLVILFVDGVQLILQIVIKHAKGLLLFLSLLKLQLGLLVDQEVQVLVLSLLIGEEVALLADLLLELADLVSEPLLLRVGVSDLRLILLTVALEVLQKLLIRRHVVLALELASVAGASRDVIRAELVQRFELFLNLVQLFLSLFIDLLSFSFESPVDFLLEGAHVVAIVLLDRGLQISFLPLELRFSDTVFCHLLLDCGFSCR